MLDLFCGALAPADAGVGLPAGLDVCMRGVQVCLGLLCRGFGARARRLTSFLVVWRQIGCGAGLCRGTAPGQAPAVFGFCLGDGHFDPLVDGQTPLDAGASDGSGAASPADAVVTASVRI